MDPANGADGRVSILDDRQFANRGLKDTGMIGTCVDDEHRNWI
jgi:hypothetical protein